MSDEAEIQQSRAVFYFTSSKGWYQKRMHSFSHLFLLQGGSLVKMPKEAWKYLKPVIT